MDRSQSTLDALVSRIRGVLGDDLVGIYLYGSYVSGGFDPAVSDLDLVAVTAPELERIDIASLERMHREFVDRNPEWDDRIEVVYIGRATLASFRTSPGSLAVISPGEPLHVLDDRAIEWLQNWYLLRETSLTLFGPPAAEVVPPISWKEFVAATARYAGLVSKQSLGDANPSQLAYTVLTMCRALMTVEVQAHGSKQDGAAWTRKRVPEWAWLIDAALRCRLSRGGIGFDDPRTRAAAEEFIALLATRIGRSSTPGPSSSATRTCMRPLWTVVGSRGWRRW